MIVAFFMPIVMMAGFVVGAKVLMHITGQSPKQKMKAAQQRKRALYDTSIKKGRFLQHCACPRCRRNCRKVHTSKHYANFDKFPVNAK